jgi:succinate dehydrogenase/fumarate reductase cytochrome b subunit
MSLNLKLKFSKFRSSTGLVTYFLMGAIFPIILIRAAQASSPGVGTSTNQGLAPYAIAAALVGAVFFVLFVRAIYLILTYASKTYEIVDFSPPPQHNAAFANQIIAFGSALLVVGSALIISSYGWASWFLFLGPTICLLCPTIILVSMELDIRKYKEVLAAERRVPKVEVQRRF